MNIDVHGHYLPKEQLSQYKSLYEARETADAIELCVKGNWISFGRGLVDLAVHMDDMKRNNIDHRFLAVYPFYFYYDKAESVEWCKSYNDGILQDIALYKGKFSLLANLPMCSPAKACEELERVMALPSVVGCQVATNIAGKDLDAPELEEFWTLAEKLDAFILLHPSYVVADPRMQPYHLKNLIGNPLDTTIAVFKLMTGGVLKRHPGLKICLSHAGGYWPLAMSRFDHGWKVRRELAYLDEKPSDFAKRFYYDTITFDAVCLEFAIARLGADRFMLGSDYPFDMSDPEPVRIVNESRLTNDERVAILSGNAQRVVSKL